MSAFRTLNVPHARSAAHGDATTGAGATLVFSAVLVLPAGLPAGSTVDLAAAEAAIRDAAGNLLDTFASEAVVRAALPAGVRATSISSFTSYLGPSTS